jgi:hypothetical protein
MNPGGGDAGAQKFGSNKPSKNSLLIPGAQVTRPLAALSVGQRHRRDLGDVEALAASELDDSILLEHASSELNRPSQSPASVQKSRTLPKTGGGIPKNS